MKRRLLIVVIGVVVAVGLAGGAWQMAYARGEAAGRAAVANARAEFVQGRPGAAGPGVGAGQGTGQGAGAGAATGVKPGGQNAGAGGADGVQRPVAGTVEKVDGATLTVATDAGSVNVTLGDQTRVTRQTAASAGDLKSGDRVVVTGARSANGAVAAATIQIQAQGQSQGQ